MVYCLSQLCQVQTIYPHNLGWLPKRKPKFIPGMRGVSETKISTPKSLMYKFLGPKFNTAYNFTFRGQSGCRVCTWGCTPRSKVNLVEMWKDSKNAIKRISVFRDTPSLVDLPEKLKIEKTGTSRCSSTFKDAIFRPESEKMTNLQIRRNSRRASVFRPTILA